MGILAIGTAVAQAIPIIALPFLTRIFTPDDFNLLAAYASVLGLLSVAACLRFNLAIPLPKNDTTAWHLLLLSFGSGGLVTLLITMAVTLAPKTIVELIKQPALETYLWLLPFGIFFVAAYDALQYWASRQRRFSLIARTRVTRAIGGTGAQLGAGTVVPGPFGLLLGHMLLSGLGFFALALSFIHSDRHVTQATGWNDLKNTAKRYRQFPIYSVPEALFNTAGLEISVLIIAASAIGPEAGYLMLAMRVLGMPMMLVGNSVAQVYLTEAPEKLRRGELADFTLRSLWTMTKVGTPPMLLVASTSPMLFPLIFGPDWAPAGLMVAWLAPMFLAQFIASPLLSILHITGRLRLAMWLQFGGAVARIASLLLAVRYFPNDLVEVFAITGAAFYVASLVVIIRIAGK